ncbi:MAG: amidase [Candidatus Neomarinimicrobiota bacterium]|nr:amidase [Candidatus Neomarinimicrobiota bacterium]
MKKYLLLLLLVIIACSDPEKIVKQHLQSTEKLLGLEFTDSERDSILPGLIDLREQYKDLRKLELPNYVTFPLYFRPQSPGLQIPNGNDQYQFHEIVTARPDDLEECAFMTVGELAHLIRTQDVTSEELTIMYLDRLKQYGPELECVISVTKELALEQSRRADKEIRAGNYRGPLHGIPYGAKDLLAVPEYRTTWGAKPYQNQIIDETATVIEKLDAAGAVLIAKLTLGALAWGDVWFDGKTRNPWDLEQGSSGSSAGPGSATAAGLVAFSIGSETWGSIVSPSTRNGVTGLRPTFGTVSRAGAMALSWTMDKLGPMCRSVPDCALIYNTIRGSDNIDRSVMDVPFQVPKPNQIENLRIAYVRSAFEDTAATKNDKAVLDILRSLGLKLIPIELPEFPTNALSFILSAEAAAAFDELTRTNRDDELVRQIRMAWPNVFRRSRFIPAVEYIQANRARVLLNEKMNKLFDSIDVYVVPSFWGDNLLRTNLTGHPCVVLPNGFNKKDSPTSISFIADLYKDGNAIAIAQLYQEATAWHKKYPPKYAIK